MIRSIETDLSELKNQYQEDRVTRAEYLTLLRNLAVRYISDERIRQVKN